MPDVHLDITMILLWVFIPLGLVFGFVAVMLMVVVHTASRPGFRLRTADRAKYRMEFAYAAQLNGWANEQGFEWVGGYEARLPMACFIAGWKQPDAPRYFLRCSGPGTEFCDFVTIFEDDHSLATCGTKDEHTLPYPPGRFLQTFHKASHEELWQRHREGEQYLVLNYGMTLCRDDLPPFDEHFAWAAREQARYVKTLILWPLRGLWWYFTRGFKSNKTIEEQDYSGRLSPDRY